MAGVFHLSFHRIAPRGHRTGVDDLRWSLAAADPAAHLLSGSFVASDGATVPYRLWAAPEPRALILLLHGAFDYSGAFDEIGPKLADSGFAALAFDQRGFGATRSRRHWCGIKRMILDTVDAAQLLRARFGNLPLFIIGESMGADVAIHTAAAREDLGIEGLVLAAPGAVTDALRRLLWGSVVRLLRYFAPKSEVNVERLSGGEFTAAGAIRLLGDPLVLRSIRPAMASGLFDLAVSTVPAARDVKVPTLTMIGSKEDVLYTKCIARLYKALGGEKTWHIFENGPHLLFHWQQSDDVLGKSIEWIDARLAEPFVSVRPAA